MPRNSNAGGRTAAAAAPSTPAGVPTPPDMTPTQKEDMERLWETQTRVVPDAVKIGSTAPALPHLVMDGMIHRLLLRMHTFFFAFLDNEIRIQNGESPAQSIRAPFLKRGKSSCLQRYAEIFLTRDSHTTETGRDIGTESEQEENQIERSDGNGKCRVVLRDGIQIVTVHHGEFMNEFDDYEFLGDRQKSKSAAQHTLGAHLHFFPALVLPAVNVAMSLAIATLWRSHNSAGYNLKRFLETSKVTMRFLHAEPRMRMSEIKTGSVGKFVSVKGSVVKARPRRLRVVTADFTCQKCHATVTHAFANGRYTVPQRCPSTNCRSRAFSIERQTARYINVQELRIQEVQEESVNHAGRTPRQMDVELTAHDLMDACRPGDTILLACQVAAINSAVAAGRYGKRAMETSTYNLYLQGHSITTMSESSYATGGNERKNGTRNKSSQIVYTQDQLRNIVQLCHADHRCLTLPDRRAFPFDLLVRSLCPSIIGHHEVKAGLLLCLLGGTPPSTSSSHSDRDLSIRSNSHILVVGDPGMGKSQMLLAVNQIATRSVYVGGNTSSTTGLTVSLSKEEGGERGIEAGALVLADQGVACVDELDKCKHLDGLLEAMEQQQVSIAKAGAVATLPARCSIVAAANPKHGSYSLGKSVAENLNISRPILSRFDLVFILRDRADKEQDRLVSSNIMDLYRDNAGDMGGRSSKEDMMTLHTDTVSDGLKSRAVRPLDLSKRLAWVAGFNEPLPASLVRDYIAYARENCKPKLTPDAAKVLQEYYLRLRHPPHGRSRNDSVPITTRQLEALIRLSQARAKACLREYVLKEDALDVVNLLKRSVEQVHMVDELGTIDRTRGGAAGMSNRKPRKRFWERALEVIGSGRHCTQDDLRRIADHVEYPLGDFTNMIDDLRERGKLMWTTEGKYKLLD